MKVATVLILILILIFILMGLAMGLAPAQSPMPATSPDPRTVYLDVSVTDRNANAIPELTARDFLIAEDDVAQRIVSFAVADGPLSVGIAWPPRLPMGNTLVSLLKATAPGTEYFVVSHDTVIRPFTTDINAARLATPQGRYELFQSDGRDGIRIGMDVLTEASSYSRRILVLFNRPLDVRIPSPSVDAPLLGRLSNLPRAGRENSYAALIKSAMQQGTQIYAILVEGKGVEGDAVEEINSCDASRIGGIPAGSRAPNQVFHDTEDQGPTCRELSADDADKEFAESSALETLSRHSGGRAYWVTNPVRDGAADTSGMEMAAARLARRIAVQYRIGYIPTNIARDGAWRKVRVEVTLSKKAVGDVWTKDGYYAPTDRKK